MPQLVSQKNFALGCRVCRILLLSNNKSVCLQDKITRLNELTYYDALKKCTNLEISYNDDLPKRLCANCAAKLTVSYQFCMEAIESDDVLKNYRDLDLIENAIYEDANFQGVDMIKEENGEKETIVNGENDAISFLIDIMNKPPDTMNLTCTEQALKEEIVNRKYLCGICNKTFKKMSNLNDHLLMHSNTKIFECEYCGKSFVQAGNYKAHLRTHTKEKPYKCEVCGKAYSQSSTLKIHKRSHTQEKNYICDVCTKRFTNSSDMKKHRMIHDLVKKYNCEECVKGFTQKIQFKKHCEKYHANYSSVGSLKAEKSAMNIISSETNNNNEGIIP